MSSKVVADDEWAGSIAVAKHLSEDGGKKAVEMAARRHRLGSALEDELAALVQDAAFAMDRKGEQIVSPAGFVRRVLEQRAIDLTRGQIRERRNFAAAVPIDDEGGGAAAALAVADGPELSALESDQALEALRRSLLDSRVSARAWQRSALLTYVAIRADDVTPGERCIRPHGGTTPHHAALWAGIWYAGQRACLEGDGSNAAVRQARSRNMRALSELHSQVRAIVRGEHD